MVNFVIEKLIDTFKYTQAEFLKTVSPLDSKQCFLVWATHPVINRSISKYSFIVKARTRVLEIDFESRQNKQGNKQTICVGVKKAFIWMSEKQVSRYLL